MEMSISREEFLRLLPVAMGRSPITEEAGVFIGSDGSRRWLVGFRPIADHRLGSVILPRHRIEITFEGYSDQAVIAFLARFHRGFQRGGG